MNNTPWFLSSKLPALISFITDKKYYAIVSKTKNGHLMGQDNNFVLPLDVIHDPNIHFVFEGFISDLVKKD